MKSKRKLDPKAIKQFFIDHTEKIAIGLVGLLFLYFTYSAVMLQANDSYKKEPKNLTDAVQAADRTIHTGPTSKTPVTEAPIPPYASITEHFKLALNMNQYPPTTGWTRRVIAERNPRGTPAVIPVEELRAVAGRGALSGRDNNAGTVGQRWVVVTGLVPYAKQLDEYKSKFETALVPGGHDVPEYVGFLVQRAEVTPGAAGEPNWEKAVTFCDDTFLAQQLQKWNGTAAEVVEMRFINPSLASPLPPRAIGEWSDEVAHPAEIKMIPHEERDQMQGGQVQVPGGARAPGFEGRGRQFQPPGRGMGVGGLPRRAVAPGGGGGTPAAPHGLFGRPAVGAKEDTAQNKLADEAAQVPPYYLLRYYDFDVEPGKQYAYRVFPLLMNPNSYEEIPESALFEPQQHNQQLLSFNPGKDQQPDANNKFSNLRIDVPWSNTCRSARLPGDNRLIAGDVDPAKSPSPPEITGQVRIIRWDLDTGANKWTQKASIFRGEPIDSAFEGADWHPKSQDGTSSEPKAETNSIIVDLTGGDLLSPRDRDKSPHSPGAMLVVTDNGELVIHDEMGETKDWADATKEPDRPGGRDGRIRYPDRGGRRGGPRAPGGGPDSSLPDMAPSGGR